MNEKKDIIESNKNNKIPKEMINSLVESGFGGAGADFLTEGRDQGLPEERKPL
ncbi:MAG: hypothetical protein IK142_01925 [Clostridiales bacterium]|nr:hypothetical protein [Clostridiales bacterium]